MRKALAFAVAFCFTAANLAWAGSARRPSSGSPHQQDQEAEQQQPAYQPYSADQLDNLLAPIALYPDPLLAQVLVAATFPDEIDEAARWERDSGTNGIDDQSWDVSVLAVAHYPSVLNMMDDNLDWTTALGQAYVYQSTDVMSSIQRLRAMAEQQGNLVDTPEQQVVNEDGEIAIWPATPEYIYVPVYDPSIVFFRPAYGGGVFAGFSFGPALVIGVWLNLDCDWGGHRVFYTGWRGSGWIARSRPHIRINTIYVNSRYTNVVVNGAAAQRPVNAGALSRYQNVHRDVGFQNRGRGAPAPARQPAYGVPNKIIDRNISPSQQIEYFRGRSQPTPTPAVRAVPQPSRFPTAPRQSQPPSVRQPGGVPEQPRPASRPQPQPPARQPSGFPQVRQPQPGPAQRPASPAATQPPNAFGRGDGYFNSRAASERGQQSRQQMNRPPAARATPASKPRPRHR